MSRAEVQHNDLVVVNPSHRLPCTGFMVEAGEHSTIPHLHECPSSRPRLRRNALAFDTERELARCWHGKPAEAAFVSVLDGPDFDSSWAHE